MKNLLIGVLIVMAFCHFNYSNAQQPPCNENYQGLTHQAELLYNPLPLSVYMPYDVIKGYIFFDSLARNLDYYQAMKLIDNLNYYDISIYLKYLYFVNDYDAVRFYLSSLFKDTSYKCSTSWLEWRLFSRLQAISSHPFIDYNINRSKAIIHLKIKDTLSKWQYEFQNPNPQHIQIVKCEVMDTIKGKVIPVCKDPKELLSSTDYKDPDPNTQANLPGVCFQFEYRLEWHRGGYKGPTMIDSTGNYWIQKDKEYIIFFVLNSVCGDSANWYYSYFPMGDSSITYTMYPIIDGKVYDPNDDFGFGTGLTPDEFKQKLRGKIKEIVSYDPALSVIDFPQIVKENDSYCFPNPFIEKTYIRFNVPKGGSDIEIEIYDYTGNFVGKVVKQYLNEGINSVEFDGTDLSNGLYMYVIKSKSDFKTGKFVILK